MNSAVQWCVASIPVRHGQRRSSPDLSEEQANGETVGRDLPSGSHNRLRAMPLIVGASIAKVLEEKREKLNAYNFKSLHYTNSLGTDLTVELPENHIWMAGPNSARAESSLLQTCQQRKFFTAPLRDGVNGKNRCNKTPQQTAAILLTASIT